MMKHVLVSFSIGKYKDEVLCDVAPMHVGHLLLGRPWQFDRKVAHDGHKNRYTLVMNNRFIVLTPLKPIEAYADQVRIAREYKMREEQLSIQEKERKNKKTEIELKEKNKMVRGKEKDSESGEKNTKKNERVNAFARKREVESALIAREQLLVLIYKDVYFTNDLNSSLLTMVVSLL